VKFAVYGAGAIGAFMGARLMRGGSEVALIARGPHLEAMRAHGLRVRSEIFGDFECRPQVTGDPAEIGEVDVVILGVKAHGLTAVAPRLGPLLGPDTIVVTTQNGIPWWYFHGLEGQWQGAHLESVDPGGVIAAHIEARRVISCLAYCSSKVVEPGIIEHLVGVRFPLGEPDTTRSERVQKLAAEFSAAGLKAPIRADMRHDIWVKVLGNAALNPISALTRATLLDILQHPPTRELARALMEEVMRVAQALGMKIRITIDQRLDGAEKVGHHKTSMLQDVEAGRPIELEPIVGAVIELADKAGVEVPNLRAMYACTGLLAGAKN
jgi:2-dehydropantoate 2-reductase